MIIDDYYSWDGCHAAVDDYRKKHHITAPMTDVDWTAVQWKKPIAP
jgi:O-methyltransferase